MNQPTPPADDDRARDTTGKFVRTPASAARDAAAADLRNERPAVPYREIAERLGYADKGDAWRGVRRAIQDVAREPVERLIETEAAELDALYVEAMEILGRNHVTVNQGRIITMRDPDTGTEVPLPDDGPRLAALNTALKIRESYRKLRGLDAATKTEVSGGVRYEIVGVDMEQLR
ncbi:hypothetical protein [Streptomyces sp. NRRL S-337]|uniref:hypothetical protein n=1 Tax=Streptomyces sp. NRRL S-337 TaxID=1463900 RepID=UPI0004C8F56F|nr:hypothetical protein [Streptomyces sp. NRRL S-337]